MEFISFPEAIKLGLKHYFTGSTCKNGNIAPRHVVGKRCICADCKLDRSHKVMERRKSDAGYAQSQKESGRRHHQRNKASILERCKGYHAANREKRNEYCRAYYLANSAIMLQKSGEYYRANKGRHREISARWQKANPHKVRASTKRWMEANRDRVRATTRAWEKANPVKMRVKWSARRSAVAQATPKWITAEHRQAIGKIYQDAADLSAATGVFHHVDHIIPLRGETVCGLHVPWNLEPLPANDNLKKSNKLIA